MERDIFSHNFARKGLQKAFICSKLWSKVIRVFLYFRYRYLHRINSLTFYPILFERKTAAPFISLYAILKKRKTPIALQNAENLRHSPAEESLEEETP